MSPEQVDGNAASSFLKLHFLLLHGSFGSVKPFRGPFAVWLGVSPAVIGLVSFVSCVVTLPLKAAISLLADTHHNICLLVALAAFTEGSSNLYMSFMGPSSGRQTDVVELATNYSDTVGSRLVCFPLQMDMDGGAVIEMACRLRCGCTYDEAAGHPNIDSTLNGTFLNDHRGVCVPSRDFDELRKDYFCEASDDYACEMTCGPAGQLLVGGAFWRYAATYAVSNVAMSTLAPLSDAVTFLVLDKTGAELPVLYSRYRLWGAVGSGAVAALSGLANDWASEPTDSEDFTSGFYINASLTTLHMITMLYVIMPHRPRRPYCAEAVQAVATPRTALLLVTLFVVGFLSSAFSLLGFVHLEGLGASKVLMGAVVAAQCLLGQLMSLSAAEYFFKRLTQRAILNLTLGASAIRCLVFALAESTWHVIPAELTYGFWYGLFCAYYTSYGCNGAHLVAQATVQCILGVAFEEFGTLL
ncbi:hypothetical protein V5799_006993 [Amblyomma americanum]|uniref:Major facilitator superfamily associated domain-containing protein n=1 Tax=Amblyomma americanum TaxID=6943 RepID=A0AAQ4DUT3_AMBAM